MIEIRTDPDVIDANAFDDVVDVIDITGNGRLGTKRSKTLVERCAAIISEGLRALCKAGGSGKLPLQAKLAAQVLDLVDLSLPKEGRRDSR